MTTAYRCTKCGAVAWERGPCWNCGGKTKPYQAGPPAKQRGVPFVRGDRMAKHFDYAAGEWIDSRSQRNRVYAAKGLVPMSYAEYKRRHGSSLPAKPGTIYAYAGQRRRRRGE